MLRKRVKDLETEYKQLQLEYQVKESRVVDLESDVEVSVLYTIWEWTCEFKCLWVSSGALLGCHVLFLLFEFLFINVFSSLFVKLLEKWIILIRNICYFLKFYFGLLSTCCTLSSCQYVVVSYGCCTVWYFILVTFSPRSMLEQKPGLS